MVSAFISFVEQACRVGMGVAQGVKAYEELVEEHEYPDSTYIQPLSVGVIVKVTLRVCYAVGQVGEVGFLAFADTPEGLIRCNRLFTLIFTIDCLYSKTSEIKRVDDVARICLVESAICYHVARETHQEDWKSSVISIDSLVALYEFWKLPRGGAEREKILNRISPKAKERTEWIITNPMMFHKYFAQDSSVINFLGLAPNRICPISGHLIFFPVYFRDDPQRRIFERRSLSEDNLKVWSQGLGPNDPLKQKIEASLNGGAEYFATQLQFDEGIFEAIKTQREDLRDRCFEVIDRYINRAMRI